LKPGDIIAIEEPFAKTVGLNARYLRCSTCLKGNKMSLIPSEATNNSKCTPYGKVLIYLSMLIFSVMFCSQNCLDTADRTILKALADSGADDINQRVLYEAIDTCGGNYEKLGALLEDLEVQEKTVFDFDLSNPADPMYKVHQLTCYLSLQRGPIIQDMQYIQRHPCLHRMKSKKDGDIAKAFMLRTFQILTQNQFGVEWQANERRANIASAMYIFGGLLNYSCVPNIDYIHVDNKLVISVRQPIKSGDQLFLSFG
jgi:hypothetical protein